MNKAFTLIELLVVISIIGILIGLSIFGLQGARESTRDARRKADLQEIRSGLEFYKSDCNTYPPSLGDNLSGSGNPNSCSGSYISLVPKDPVTGEVYPYSPSPQGCNPPDTICTQYSLCADLEQSGTTCVANP